MKMKKILFLFSLLAIALIFAACGNSSSDHSNSIRQANLSEREEVMLSTAGSRYFAFDFSANEKYGYIKTWIERYEHGKKVETFGNMTTKLEPEQQGLLIAVMKTRDDGISDWAIAVSSGRTVSNLDVTQETPVLVGNGGINTNTNRSDIKIEGTEVVLASIEYKSLGGSGTINTLSQDYFNNPENHQKELDDIDSVFIVKSKFSKTEK